MGKLSKKCLHHPNCCYLMSLEANWQKKTISTKFAHLEHFGDCSRSLLFWEFWHCRKSFLFFSLFPLTSRWCGVNFDILCKSKKTCPNMVAMLINCRVGSKTKCQGDLATATTISIGSNRHNQCNCCCHSKLPCGVVVLPKHAAL